MGAIESAASFHDTHAGFAAVAAPAEPAPLHHTSSSAAAFWPSGCGLIPALPAIATALPCAENKLRARESTDRRRWGARHTTRIVMICGSASWIDHVDKLGGLGRLPLRMTSVCGSKQARDLAHHAGVAFDDALPRLPHDVAPAAPPRCDLLRRYTKSAHTSFSCCSCAERP